MNRDPNQRVPFHRDNVDPRARPYLELRSSACSRAIVLGSVVLMCVYGIITVAAERFIQLHASYSSTSSVAIKTCLEQADKHFRPFLPHLKPVHFEPTIMTPGLGMNSTRFTSVQEFRQDAFTSHATEEQFVSSDGDDSNDGRSSGHPKRTIYASLQALKGGGTRISRIRQRVGFVILGGFGSYAAVTEIVPPTNIFRNAQYVRVAIATRNIQQFGFPHWQEASIWRVSDLSIHR